MLLLLFFDDRLRMADMESIPTPKLLPPLPDIKLLDARDEMNFAEFPIALLTDRRPKDLSSVEYTDTIHDPVTRKETVRKLTIAVPKQIGLPTALDDEVLLGLIQLTKVRNGFKDRRVHFSRYELLRLLGWSNKGPNYRRLEQSMDRWVSVILDYQNAWWDKEASSFVTEKFHMLDNVRIYETEHKKKGGQTVLPFSSFLWNEIVFQSFQAGFLKRIDLEFYLRLKHHTARRLYRFLDKRFYHQNRCEFDLTDFAFTHVGLNRSSCLVKAKSGERHLSQSKIREKLTPGIEELENLGYIKRVRNEQRYNTEQRGQWRIIFERQQAEVKPKVVLPPTLPFDSNPLIQVLIDRGVSSSIADELVRDFPADQIEAKIEIQEWMNENDKKQTINNPAGWLVKAIREDYTAPKGFVSKSERLRREKAAEENRTKHAQSENDKRRKDREERDAIEAERVHVENYLNALTETERKELEVRAIELGDDFQRMKAREKDVSGKIMRNLLTHQEVLRVYPMSNKNPEP